jgi:hypothetical protein
MNIKIYLDNCRALGIEVEDLGTGFTVKRPENFEMLPPAIQWSIDRHLGLDGRESEDIGYASRR